MNDDNCKRQAWEEWQQLYNIQYYAILSLHTVHRAEHNIYVTLQSI